jgi:hypothetical protein
MRKFHKVALGLGLALSTAGCSDYLSAPDLTSDPTKVTALTQPGPLYIGIQEAGPPQREGQLARFAAEYTQQVAGFSRQQIGYDLYQADATDVDPYFGAIYGTNNTLNGGGGLLDIHKMQQLARKKNDSLFVGIGKVYEAMYMGLAADQFGDIPYREAADSNNLHPKFDSQLQIYADLQAQLDSAINIFLPASGATNAGPCTDASELIYACSANPLDLGPIYIQVAHSLKARLYMHTAEVDPSAYAKALAEVPLGISTPANDFLWFHDPSPQGQNIWWQFMSARGDIAPGAAFVEIQKRRIAAGVENFNQMTFTFLPTSAGPTVFAGVRPTGSTSMTTNGVIYNGAGIPAGEFSLFGPFIDGASAPGDWRSPEITFRETQLIGAEAAFQTGGAGAAQPFLDAARASRTYGTFAGAVIDFGAAPGSLPATLQNIIEEKYTALYLNPEVWNDYKRTCFPSLAPAPSVAAGTTPRTTPIVGRLPYGLTELNANGANAPAVTTQSRNRNDPNACPVLNYVSSVPLAN